MQEQRFFAAAVEHERIAPFQPHDRLAFTRFLGQQEADRILVERLRRRRADVDLLRARPRRAAAAARAPMVVDDDVRCLETALAAHADERRIARDRRRRYRHTEYSWFLSVRLEPAYSVRPNAPNVPAGRYQ